MTANSTAQANAAVLVSVVVPTCNRVHLLKRCVDALLEQTLLPCEYEIIIVDDAPCHQTRQLAAMWSARADERGLSLRYISNHGTRGPAASRNLGWRLARGALLAFTDDDAIVMPSWLYEGLAVIDDRTDAVCGRLEIPVPPRPTDYQRDAETMQRESF